MEPEAEPSTSVVVEPVPEPAGPPDAMDVRIDSGTLGDWQPVPRFRSEGECDWGTMDGIKSGERTLLYIHS